MPLYKLSLTTKSFRFLIFQASNSAFCCRLIVSFPKHLLSTFSSYLPLLCVSNSSFSFPVFLFFSQSSLLQIESFKLNFRENARSRTDHGADIITWPVVGDSPAHLHPLRNSVSFNDSLVTARLPRSSTTPALLSASQDQEGDTVSLNTLLT